MLNTSLNFTAKVIAQGIKDFAEAAELKGVLKSLPSTKSFKRDFYISGVSGDYKIIEQEPKN